MNAELADILSRALRFIPRNEEEERDLVEDIQTALKDLQPALPVPRITPGPWELRGSRLVTDANGVVIADDVSANHPGTPEANARLIAAAPEMAAALLALVGQNAASSLCVHKPKDCFGRVMGTWSEDAAEAGRAALRKAGLLS